jgi:hypothetical protein
VFSNSTLCITRDVKGHEMCAQGDTHKESAP